MTARAKRGFETNARLMTQTWICFDLDDTLHDFTCATTQATNAVFTHLHQLRPDITIATLREQYREICQKYVTAFTDGRSAFAYRFERMEQLLHRTGVNEQFPTTLVTIYVEHLERALKLTHDAYTALTRLRQAGHNIAVVTEGPHDAQIWTLEKLGISSLVDQLITSNQERVSKQDGLFGVFSDRTKASPPHCLVVGDSIQNDILPTLAIGMNAVHYDPRNLGPAIPGASRIHYLSQVENIATALF